MTLSLDYLLAMSAEVGKKSSRALPPLGFGLPSLLPPCVVCGEKGNGLHYGVNTCNSCKGFFYRNVTRTTWSPCTSPQHCKNVKRPRHKCCTCRYELCVSKGMSKNAIRTGRYTYETKTQYVKEVEKLKMQVRMCKIQATLLTPEKRQKELDELIDTLTTEHLKQTPTPEFMQGLLDREAKFLEEKELQNKIFGSRNPLPYNEYEQIYEDTGIDIGDRRKILKKVMPSLEKSLKAYIVFMKNIPGFKTIPIQDQLLMVKGMIFENELMTTYHMFSLDNGVWHDPFNPDLLMDPVELSAYYPPETEEAYNGCVVSLQKLDLVPEEQAVLQAFIVAHTDLDVSPEGRRILLSMQEVIFDAMYQLITRHHDDAYQFLTRIIDVINKIKEASPIVKKGEDIILGQYPDVEVTPTLMELYTC